MRVSLVLLGLVVAFAAVACVSATYDENEIEWIQPAFIESLNDDNPAAQVAWEQPKKEDINHRDHRNVHVTLMAQHLDLAADHQKLGNGVKTIQHTDAAELHNTAAVMHIKADEDVDYVEPAVKASRKAYAKTRSLIARTKPVNMRPKAVQPNAAAEAAVKVVASLNAELAPQAIEERQWKRSRGLD